MARKKKKNKNNHVFKFLVTIILIISALTVYQKFIKPSDEVETKIDTSVKQDKVDKLEDKKPVDKPKPISQRPKDTIQKKKIPPIPVKETDNQLGELRIEGQVIAVDEKTKTIEIEQIMDDNSVKVNPNIKVSEKAIIQNNEGKIKLDNISIGAVVDIILTDKKIARSVTVIE